MVAPGGGYGALAMDHEGRQVAAYFNAMGVAAFVLKYRLGPKYRHPVELGDAQRALRLVRTRAQEFGVNAARIGLMGFSAGGHLAATAGTRFDAGNASAADPIDRASSRPDFLILGYPVITFEAGVTHAGSVRNLLGENPDPKLIELMSNELHVTAADTADVPLPHQRRHGRRPRKQRPLLPGAAQGEGARRDAHLRERPARCGARARRSRAQRVASVADELVERAGAADETGQ